MASSMPQPLNGGVEWLDVVLVAFDERPIDHLKHGGNRRLQSRAYLHGPAVDQILADDSSLNGLLWPLSDHEGTVHDLVKLVGSTTQVQNHIVYDSYGRVTSETATAVDHLFSYTGRERDESTGLYYYRARWYDPAVGRFLSEDPSGFSAGDANLTRYVGNSPVNATDPSGGNTQTPIESFDDVMRDLLRQPPAGKVWRTVDDGSRSGLRFQVADTIDAPGIGLPASDFEMNHPWVVGTVVGAGNVLDAISRTPARIVGGLMDLGTAIFDDAPNQLVIQQFTGQPLELRSNILRNLDAQRPSYLGGVGEVGLGELKGLTRYSNLEAAYNYYQNPSYENGIRLQDEPIDTGLILLAARASLARGNNAILPDPIDPLPAHSAAGNNFIDINHVNAAAAEFQLARTVAALPNEVVLRWGDSIGTHGADTISFNKQTGQVSLWDSKFRTNPMIIQPSSTFQQGSSSLTNAVDQAVQAVNQSGLTAAQRAQAVRSLNSGNFRRITVGTGAGARNSTKQ